MKTIHIEKKCYRNLSLSIAAASILISAPVFADTGTTPAKKTANQSSKLIQTPPQKKTHKSKPPAKSGGADNLRQMFTLGKADGIFRMAYYANHNAFFNSQADRQTAAVGGELGFTSAELQGFSLRLSAYAQRNFARTNGRKGFNRDLGRDISALGEAYLQWQGHDFQIRAGNQLLKAPPFTATYDYRIIPQVYQGVKVRYGDADHYLMAMRMFRFKSRISNSYDRTTNYNASFSPFPPNTTGHTNGFWALGSADEADVGAAKLSGQAWFFNYQDYANMYYTDATVARASGSIRPFLSAQFIRETDVGKALLGPVDNHTYGAQLGIKHHSLTATLNYDYIPHRAGTFLNGALATPYASQEASGPLFAQPFLTSTQDLGSGNAYAAEIKGAPLNHVFAGARYSYMDLTPARGSRSIGQSEYMIFGIYNFSGSLDGLSVLDFFAYQKQKVSSIDYWENRFTVQYSF
ncbi:MAG: OprD family outer membrane porin [Salinisphaera sp.]|jgi:hypothetical protein|nr:OprD family outer membrane porin [Salinisphaera sp.]